MRKTDVLSYVGAMQSRLAGTPDFDVQVQDDGSGVIRVRSGKYPNTEATFDLARNRVTAQSGSRLGAGALNELLNNDVLVKDAAYLVDGHIYVRTDALGRPFRFRINYNRSWSVNHSGRPSRELEKRDGDQVGHVVAVALYGPHERFNIVPMPEDYNQGWYFFQEQMLGGALAKMRNSSENWFLDLRIDIDYDPASLRPSALHLDAEIDDACGYYAKLQSECVY